MKKTFLGYYRPSEKEFSELWKNCLFVLDANVLLNLYRYSQETREELIGILKAISDRLWVPYQAALEYQRNRLFVIGQQATAYEEIQDNLRKTRDKLDNDLRSFTRHPFIEVEPLLKRIKNIFAEIEKELNEHKQAHPNLIDEDYIRDDTTTLLEGKVGSPYPSERMDEVYKEGKIRYDSKIPPGYSDVNKEERKQYGDLILWFQVINKAKETKRPVILITDDRKDDWWWRFEGKTIGPRPELVEEMLSKAGVSFYMYQTDSFMKYAREYLEQRVKEEAIDEVRDVRRRDEEKYMKTIQTAASQLPDEITRAMIETAKQFTNEELRAMEKAGALRAVEQALRAIAATFPWILNLKKNQLDERPNIEDSQKDDVKMNKL